MQSMSLCWFYSIFLVFLVQTEHSYAKLLFLQSVFRHGDRTPINLYPNDPNPVEVWTEGLGKLTRLGKRQHYMLGKQIASLYSDFITSNPEEVFVNSTGIERCLSSAESHLAGLYDPTPEWQFVPGFHWQPIPIHYYPEDVDHYLNPDAKCPRANEESNRLFNSTAFKKFYEENMPMLESLSSCAGVKLTNKNAYELASDLKIEMEYNLTIPSCMLPYYNQLQRFTDVTHNIIYQSAFIRRVRAGPLIGEIINNINRKIAGEIPKQKVQIYSTREGNVGAILSALGLFNDVIPPYSSTLLFELHESSTDDNFAVRLLYFNSTRPQDGDQIPYVMQLPGCTEYCPLQNFDNYTRQLKLIPLDWSKECGLGN